MKKYLIIGLALVTVFSMWAVGVSAVSIGNQSIDVTVGEVDTISGDDEEQSFIVPDTGLFGLESHSASAIMAVFFVVPMVVITMFLFMGTHNRRKEKSRRKD